MQHGNVIDIVCGQFVWICAHRRLRDNGMVYSPCNPEGMGVNLNCTMWQYSAAFEDDGNDAVHQTYGWYGDVRVHVSARRCNKHGKCSPKGIPACHAAYVWWLVWSCASSCLSKAAVHGQCSACMCDNVKIGSGPDCTVRWEVACLLKPSLKLTKFVPKGEAGQSAGPKKLPKWVEENPVDTWHDNA